MNDDLDSRVIIAEFFHTGEKNYTPKDFIAAVREGTADTALAPVVTESGAWLGEAVTTIVADNPMRVAERQPIRQLCQRETTQHV